MVVRFDPIRTERLILRPPVLADAESFFRRHADPQVALYQDWELPYTRERAEKAIAAAADADGPPSDDGWWQITVVRADDPSVIVGDLAVGIHWSGRTGEVGYSFDPDQWGRGYATEAAKALVRWLFETYGVKRVQGSLHPDNPASARVLEHCGLVFEGRSKLSFWVGDENSDDVTYGMTFDDWRAWEQRPRHRPDRVELVEVGPENARAVAGLVTHKSQERFVAPMIGNLRDALVPPIDNGAPLLPWYRAIVADGEVVGFIMAAEPTATLPEPYLWRFLIDRRHQGRGIGSAALDRFENRCRSLGAERVAVSWVEGPGGPARFYLGRGYEPTGEIVDGEIVAVKPL